MTISTRGVNEPTESNGQVPNLEETEERVEDPASDGEPDFPHEKLAELDTKISSPRWVVPVLPDQELECLLQASIDLCKKGIDTKSEACQRFFREGLTISFTKILTDDAVNSWKPNIQLYIYQNCQRLVELCVVKLNQDWFPLLDLLAMLFNPNCKFHIFNNARQPESIPLGLNVPDEEIFGRPAQDSRLPRGWLVDLINSFGNLGGFQILLERFQSGENLSVAVMYALLRPFGLCYELLTVHTIVKYLMPIIDTVLQVLDSLTDEELKKEAKNELKNDSISCIIKAAKCLVSRVPGKEDTSKDLEIFRLRMILRLLQISSFNGKMNALNEVNKVIASVAYYPHRHTPLEEDEWLTPQRMAKWIKENQVLEIVLRDSLHQPQYVEKLEKILRFIIKERCLTLEDLDAIWAAQAGKHEAIVKNVHDLLAKLAWDFSPEQLDHLFECFQSSWTNANKKQRERLLELIRHLAEDDKDGVMAHKVLTLFWNLAHSDDVPTEIMDQALAAHIKILDYSCSQERDAQKTCWLDKCVEELKSGDKWVLPALKQIREICCLYEQSPNLNHNQRSQHIYYRQEIIERLQNNHTLVILVSDSLKNYIDKVKKLVSHSDLESSTFCIDGRYSHELQVQERLNFLRFLLKDGQLWLCSLQAKQIWKCLAEDGVFPSDREACFKWFSKLMGEEPDLDPAINREFFEDNILQLDPTLLTESGMKCFERFFKAVNKKEGKLVQKRRSIVMEDPDLIGMDYLWRVITNSGEEIANRAIEIMREVSTNLGSQLTTNIYGFHETYIAECLDRLRAHYDNVTVLMKEDLLNEKDREEAARMKTRLKDEAVRMCRVMKVLQEYISECDGSFVNERKILPLHRACRGKCVILTVRFLHAQRAFDDIDIYTHTNETLASFRRSILRRIKAGASVKVELVVNSDSREPIILTDDRKLLSQLPVRDKMILTAKLCQANSNTVSSPETSSDSSTSSPQHPYDGPNLEAENMLPGVLMSRKSNYAKFLFQLSDLGCQLHYPPLRDGARTLLQLVPPDQSTVEKLKQLFGIHPTNEHNQDNNVTVESVFFDNSCTKVLYYVEVMYSLIMPASDPMSDEAFEFQYSFIKSGHAPVVLEMLTKNNFLPNADVATKRAAYVTVLKMCKLLLTVIGHVLGRVPFDDTSQSQEQGGPDGNCGNTQSPTRRNSPIGLLRTINCVFNQGVELMIRSVAKKLAAYIDEQPQVMMESNAGQMFLSARSWELPDTNTIRAIMRLAWAASTGSLSCLHSPQEMHNSHLQGKMPDPDDVILCREALQVLTVSLVLNCKVMDTYIKDSLWHTFIIDLLLLAKHRVVRCAASDQFLLILYDSAQQPLHFCISLLFSHLDTTVTVNCKNSSEYFMLLCRLINYALMTDCPLPNAEVLLDNEIAWLKKIRANVKETGETQVDEALLEGHLNIAKELLGFLTPEQKYLLGSNEIKGVCLIRELVEDFIFPASKLMLKLTKTGELMCENAIPVCHTPATANAAFDLLVALCMGCVPNMKLLVHMLTEMFYSEREKPLTEWDYVPPIGPRSPKGFCGLKNAGATCYMNSVLQQLYMVESIRSGLLAAEGAATDLNEDFSGEERLEVEGVDIESNDTEINDEKGGVDESRKEYNIGILKQVQAIFGHLAYSELQYYVPRGLWKHFKLQGKPVNLREQQDAVEFYLRLVESLDEALKALGQEQIMSKILVGSFSDQKICKGCPHRYFKEELFSVINVDIRNHSSLLDSLEQYVKGEILEGADAYHCDKCNKKVVTVKRPCVKKLPPVLAIQLKRFDYDYERECAIKFNDYFEFPRDLDMDPYTVSGLAKLEGELIDCDYDELSKEMCTKYQLTGIVVHSGQASGGHYYSYILHRLVDGTSKWYKFDDGDVSECKMEDDEEMKSQCFGGDYMGEVFDHIMKRLSYRKQKRWWNAYMLYYTRLDVKANNPTSHDSKKLMKMPPAIERGVRRQNVVFMHNRNQFSAEYFQFIKKLVSCNSSLLRLQNDKLTPDSEELSMLSVQLASRFLFHTGFHTKKCLRGAAYDWYEVLSQHLRHSAAVRYWFAQEIIFQHPNRLSEYLLSSPSAEVRAAFMKITLFLAHFSLHDGPCPSPILNGRNKLLDPNATLSDHLLHALILLLDKEISDHGKHLVHYFTLFQMYAQLGLEEKAQLLRLDVAKLFISVALEEGPGPAIKSQYFDCTKLHQVVSMLVRCCDLSSRTQNSNASAQPLPNPFCDPQCSSSYLIPVQPEVAELLFGKVGYAKKLIDNPNPSEELVKLLQFCSWENPIFSKNLLSETLRQIACTIYQDLKHYLDWLLHLLLIEDSWQTHRIHNALQGITDSDAKEGLFDIVTKSKTHYQKKAYQCIKCMTTLFSKCRAAHALLTGTEEIRRKWVHCNEWFPFPANVQYSCDNWLLPTKSNDSSNGYFPERSNSTRKLLVHSVELGPQDEPEVEEVSEEGEGLQSLEWNGLVVSKYFGNASTKDRRKNRVQIRKVDETSEEGIAPMVELQQRSFKPIRRENNQRRTDPNAADSGDEEFSWFCGKNKRMSSPSDLPQSQSRHSLHNVVLTQEIQDKTDEIPTKGSFEIRHELVSDQESTSADNKDKGKEIEDTLGHMTLEEIDQPSTSAES
ncbi:hypothetical protein RUM43_000792 [Polyplax serrata]|uniref:USP domain-containing protein n=1 Tax=Polyplax serrata TaxID=468196 RepID=A0AAN8SHQ2_POLSC